MKGGKYTVSDIKAAIDRDSSSVVAVAKQLECAKSTVYGYFRRYPDLRAYFNEKSEQTTTSRDHFSVDEFLKVIKKSNGNKSYIAREMKCSRQNVNNYLEKHPELAEAFNDAREKIVDTAEEMLYAGIQSGDQRLIIFTLETQGRDRGWSKRHYVSADVTMFTPEMREAMMKLGISESDAVREFEAMVIAHAEKING